MNALMHPELLATIHITIIPLLYRHFSACVSHEEENEEQDDDDYMSQIIVLVDFVDETSSQVNLRTFQCWKLEWHRLLM